MKLDFVPDDGDAEGGEGVGLETHSGNPGQSGWPASRKERSRQSLRDS